MPKVGNSISAFLGILIPLLTNQPLVGLFCFSVCMGFWAERAALGEMG